jgi:hypothetical protein
MNAGIDYCEDRLPHADSNPDFQECTIILARIRKHSEQEVAPSNLTLDQLSWRETRWSYVRDRSADHPQFIQ